MVVVKVVKVLCDGGGVEGGCREGVEEEEGKGRVGVVRGGSEAGRPGEVEGVFWEYGEDVCMEVSCGFVW